MSCYCENILSKSVFDYLVVLKKLHEILGPNHLPSKHTVLRLVKEFEERDSVTNKLKSGCHRTARSK